MLNSILFLIPFLFFIHCSTFLLGERPTVNPKVSKFEKDISYELIGWKGKENRIKATSILDTFEKSKKFKSLSYANSTNSEWKIQIVLDESPQLAILLGEPVQPVSWVAEKRPGRYTLYLLNRVLSAATRLVLPIFQVREERITFRIWKDNLKKGEYIYPVETIRAIGWISFILMFYDDKKEIESIYSDYTLKFLNDSETLYE
ncbi:MAG TPA: hypothetical protein PK079_05235 [Leptospiraceae bacterium]|nr:hypothetical protein [Leptospiraceae bacterium]HMW06275.1 hypothetical protein [Leptospiraceae bacterium]HMX33164.1 hypothetical protein [Leptospiraceae bacterium]HMY31737.1 hypothetical protein [Leptospiraceae bacterium]HMZ64530.1 hypothetical protein [Leptospiraceae bacterium]